MLVVAGLIIAFVLVVLFSNRATRGCRWRAYRREAGETGRRWRCAACGAETVTEGERPPGICLRG